MEPLIVLVVDDEPQIRGLVARLLASDPRVEVVQAGDGMEALRILERGAVDVVISDEVMPEINGVRLLETIRARWPGARRVLFTARPGAELAMDAVNRAGVHRVLVKGVDPMEENLAELVEECLAARSGAGRPRPPSRTHALGPRPKVLAVVGELALRRKVESALAGFDVRFATREEVSAGIDESPADVVVIDLSDGVGAEEPMGRVRALDLDRPIVIAAPRRALKLAHDAISYGAYRYLLHPFSEESLATVVHQAMALRRMARLRRSAATGESRDAAWQLGDRAAVEVHFRLAIEQLFMVYQPIVAHSTQKVLGYEAFVRSREPTLASPGPLFDAARRLGRVEQLGRAIRTIAIEQWRARDDDELLFLNLDVKDIEQAELLEPAIASMAERIVLELTERAALDEVDGIASHIAALRARGFRIAVDDLGAGYAGLSSFALLEPDIVKLDMSLVRDIHRTPVNQRLVAGLQEACDDLGVEVVAEGVETEAELRALQVAGCDVFQGYLFARPAARFPPVSWH
jgi:EAL domain-containing protein (putative c-di-GMP-specific phosphodiesterase class I)